MKASNRVRTGHAIVAGLAFLAMILGNSAAVRATTIANFATTLGGPNNYSYTGGATSTIVTVPGTGLTGTVSYDPTFFPGTNLAATITLNNIKSTAAATVVAGDATQGGWSGSYSINQSGNILTVAFTGAILSVGGGSGTLQSGAGGTVTITANFGSPITQPEAFSFGWSNVTPLTPTVSGGVIQNWTAHDVNTQSATVVPEPSSFAIAGLGALGLIGYGLRRRKGA